MVWASVEDGRIAVNSAVGRKWPTNLERDPAITVLVYDETNPYDYVEVRGTAPGDDRGRRRPHRPAGQEVPGRRLPTRSAWRASSAITYVVEPSLVRHQKQR